jgi:hypothetical protein
MGLGKLDIWIRYEPGVTWSCKVDTVDWPQWGGWLVTIKDCTGRILEWCGKRYSRIGPTKHGHIEIEVPPGCYILSAISLAKGCNTFTAPAFVQVGCDEAVCVNLLAPIENTCSWYYIAGVRQGVRDKVIPKEVAERAIATAKEVLRYVPKPTLRPGEVSIEREIEEIEKVIAEKKA